MLEGLQVLDLTDEKGLLCGKILADMGAEVIRLEKPGQPVVDCYGNRGKHAVSLNLELPGGQALFLRLVKPGDVLVESLRPGYLASLGLSFDRLKELNPRLIMASLSPFGQSGPYSQFRSSELVSAAMGGQAYLNGEPGRPPIQPPVPLASSLACLNAVTGILLAVRQRHTTGRGQYLDISLQECSADALDHALVRYFYTGEIAERSGAYNWSRSLRIFPCRDGNIQLLLFHQWDTLVEWLDSENMAGDLTDKKYLDEAERRKNLDHIVSVLEKWTLGHGVDELVESGQAMRFPWSRVNSIPQVVEDIQLNERGYFLPVKDPAGKEYKFPCAPVKMSASPWQVNPRLPEAGEYNREVYCRRLGLSEAEIEQLAREGVI
jgi:crotonobetainyl-CoA:carnitine CoA-transferase CaiB-like acyl-CoA transferase